MGKLDIERVKQDNPIQNVVARYVHLSKAGRLLKGLCPFHQEKTPSFTIYPEKDGGHYYCFGCNVGGDVIEFLMAIEGIDFLEACRRLGARDLPDQIAPPPKVKAVREIELGPKERQVLGVAQRVYHAALLAMSPSHPIRQYLAKRGFDINAIRRFRLGWCSGEQLIPALKFLKIRKKIPLEMELLREGRAGVYEFLKDRIVIPAVDKNGAVIHMVGRAVDEDAKLRYLSLVGLSKPLYGASTLRRQEPVVVVEGIFCRFSLEMHGVQAVATMGTALGRASDLKDIPVLVFVPQNDNIDVKGATAQEWIQMIGDATHPASRWLESILQRAGKNTRLTIGQAAVVKWMLEVGHGQVVELPPGVKDVNDLHQDGGLDDWLDTWATWRER